MARHILTTIFLLFHVHATAATPAAYSGPHNPGQHLTFDCVIIGGGTGGLTLANRLSADPSRRIAVVEAGDSVFDNPNVLNVTQFGLGINTSIDWRYTSTPQRYANQRIFSYTAGKALGGTSVLNGMTYLRAEAAQIDAWERLGNPGWNWASLFPYYKKSEQFVPPNTEQTKNGGTYLPEFHGTHGPLKVGWSSYLMGQNMFTILRRTMQTLGLPFNPDANSGIMRGFTTWPLTLDPAQDIRMDAARAHYWPIAKQRSNLVVFTNTTATRIVWKRTRSGEKLVAAGVVAVRAASGGTITIKALSEVILSAGSLRSPGLLEHSGVGNHRILQAHGITPLFDLPAVGENLLEQPNVLFLYASNTNFSGYPTFVTYATASDLFSASLISTATSVRSRIPALATAIVHANNFTNLEAQSKLLNIQADIIFGPDGQAPSSSVPVAEMLWAPTNQGVIVAPHWTLLPFSKGNVHISSDDSLAAPDIDPNFWMSDIDGIIQAAAARVVRKVFSTPPLKDYVVAEVAPGLEAVPEDADDEAWVAYFKESFSPNYHPIGTCAMMAQSLGGVVDSELRVYGTHNVRVVDASVVPMQPSGHLTSTIYAIAERASEMILKSQMV